MTGNKAVKQDELFQDVTLARTVSVGGEKPASPEPAPAAADQKKAGSSEPCEEWAVVVDDSPTVLTVVTGILRNLNIGTHPHRSATSAFKFMKELPDADFKKITMVLSDFQMPEMNGVEFLQAIRADERMKHLPFVVISGIVEKPLLTQFAALGVAGYVVKPFKAQAIIDRIMQISVARQKKAQAG